MNNQPSAGPWPGRFVWHDLMTTDAARSQRFYCELFGWQIHEVPMQGFTYRMIVAGPGPIGGIVEEKTIPASHWMPYLAVDDVDAMAARITKAKGTVCVPPSDIPRTGRFAVVGDPLGAYFSIYKGLPDSPGFDPDQPVAGRVCWNELLTTDDGAAQRFYGALFGWKDQPKDMGPMGTYHVQTLGDAQAGGIMKNPQNGAPSAWLVYFLAPDLARATAKAVQLGAKPCVENMPIPGVGAFSMLTDPVGAVFALFAPIAVAPAATTTGSGSTSAASTASTTRTKSANRAKATAPVSTKPSRSASTAPARTLVKAAPRTARPTGATKAAPIAKKQPIAKKPTGRTRATTSAKKAVRPVTAKATAAAKAKTRAKARPATSSRGASAAKRGKPAQRGKR
jgi:predicted enzyme related to lactoylglutathione lyase